MNGVDKIRVDEEYYSFEPKRIRSTKFWKNSLRDSVWSYYDENGNCFLQERYMNDSLVESIRH